MPKVSREMTHSKECIEVCYGSDFDTGESSNTQNGSLSSSCCTTKIRLLKVLIPNIKFEYLVSRVMPES